MSRRLRPGCDSQGIARPLASVATMWLAQNQPDDLLDRAQEAIEGSGDACGADASWICKRILDATDNEGLAETSDLLFGTLGKIVLIILVSWLVSRLVRRAIDRFTVRVTNP